MHVILTSTSSLVPCMGSLINSTVVYTQKLSIGSRMKKNIEEQFGEPNAGPSQLTPSSQDDKEVNAVVWWTIAKVSMLFWTESLLG